MCQRAKFGLGIQQNLLKNVNDMLLSICIPTFNRYEYLISQLNTVASLVRKTSAFDLEIIVVDNCSDDVSYRNLNDFIQELSIKCRVYKNSQNIGLSKNLIKCMEYASGDFVWILSDDDIVLVESLDFLIDSFLSSPDMLYLKSGVYGEIFVDFDIDYVGADAVIAAMSSYSMFGLISANIYSKNLYKNLSVAERNSDTLFPHVAMVFDGLSNNVNGFKCRLVSNSGAAVVSWTEGNRSYNDAYLDALVGMLRLSNLLGEKSDLFLHKLIKDFGGSHIARYCFFKNIMRDYVFKKFSVKQKCYLLNAYFKFWFRRGGKRMYRYFNT